MPFTYSIANGLAFGFIAYAALKGNRPLARSASGGVAGGGAVHPALRAGMMPG